MEERLFIKFFCNFFKIPRVGKKNEHDIPALHSDGENTMPRKNTCTSLLDGGV